jgi:predicted secreted protein
MHILRSRLVLAAILIAPLAAHAAKPVAPTVTVGAALKQLRFDVEPVAGASYYELWFLPNGAATWVKYMDTLAADPLFRVTVSAHLLDWYNARYRVRACNSEGCSSTANIAVTQYMKETVGYLKPRAAAPYPYAFGQSPTLSADGKTLAVLAGERIGTHMRSAALYVYQKTDSGWRRQARLLPPLIQANTGWPSPGGETIPRQLAISADGTAIVLGLPGEYLPTSSARAQGAVYVFRKSGTTWALEQKIGPYDIPDEQLGLTVDIDTNGQTIALCRGSGNVGAFRYVEIYRRGTSGWTPSRQFARPDGIRNFDMSGDGKVLVIYRRDRTVETYFGTNFASRQTLTRFDVRSTRKGTVATNFDGSVIATSTMGTTPPEGANWQSHVMAFRRDGSGWLAEPAFTYINGHPTLKTGYSEEFAFALAVSDDGRFIAVGDPSNRYDGTGALHTPFTAGSVVSGAVFIFERKPSSWKLRNLIKPNVNYSYTRFSAALAFGDNNRVLAVGAVQENSAAREIDGDQTSLSGPGTGALWLY